MLPKAEPRVWLEIDHRVVRANFEHIAAKVAPAKVLAVLKADAYGLGALPIARTLLAAGAARVGVAEPSEAYALLELGCDLQVMSAVLPDEVPDLIRYGVTMPITDLRMATLIGETACKMGMVAKGHVKIDSGMGRLGILIEEADDIVPACCAIPGLQAEGIFTHFPMAYKQHGEFTCRQLDLFKGLIARLEAKGITFKYRHCANSDAINNYPPATRAPFNLVRAGLNLHGLFDPDGAREMDITPVLSLKTRLVAVRDMPAGRTIGYGATCRLSGLRASARFRPATPMDCPWPSPTGATSLSAGASAPFSGVSRWTTRPSISGRCPTPKSATSSPASATTEANQSPPRTGAISRAPTPTTSSAPSPTASSASISEALPARSLGQIRFSASRKPMISSARRALPSSL